MRERAILVGADFSLRTRDDGSGVEITLDVPAAPEQPA
jgi:signal transduction histidine kinase